MEEPSPQPSTSASSAALVCEELVVKSEKEEIDQLQLPKEAKVPLVEDDDRIARICFRCEFCGMDEMVHYKGTEPPFVFGVKLLEESYIMRDPFQPHPPKWRRKPEYFVILGAPCCLCDKVVCRGAECSFYYLSTFCLQCAQCAMKRFPLEVQTKLRKQIVNTQKSD